MYTKVDYKPLFEVSRCMGVDGDQREEDDERGQGSGRWALCPKVATRYSHPHVRCPGGLPHRPGTPRRGTHTTYTPHLPRHVPDRPSRGFPDARQSPSCMGSRRDLRGMALLDLNVAIPQPSIARLIKTIYPQRPWMLIYLASRPRISSSHPVCHLPVPKNKKALYLFGLATLPITSPPPTPSFHNSNNPSKHQIDITWPSRI